ncbi:MAG TPA: hypothetical protein VFZ73_01445, partial [Gemmatimonadaceae bacterium]
MNFRPEPGRRREPVPHWWLLIAGGGVFGLAVWLRSLSPPALGASFVAAGLLVAMARNARAGAAGSIASLLLVAAATTGVYFQTRLARIEQSWEQYAARVADAGIAELRRAVQREIVILDTLARRALDAPLDPAGAFGYLARLGPFAAHRGVALSDRNGPVAWAGTLRSPEASQPDTAVLQWTPFYVVMRRVAQRDGRVAEAEAVLHAYPPANRIAGSLDAGLRLGQELVGFAYRAPDSSAVGAWQLIPVANQSVAVQPR